MEYIEHHFKGVKFTKIMKAQFRKYFDENYRETNCVVEMDRKLIDKNKLLITRIHMAENAFVTYYFVEKIIIDRQKKIYDSKINSTYYKEECNFTEKEDGVTYSQKYSVPFFFKHKKQEIFKKGCDVVEKILSSNIIQ